MYCEIFWPSRQPLAKVIISANGQTISYGQCQKLTALMDHCLFLVLIHKTSLANNSDHFANLLEFQHTYFKLTECCLNFYKANL